MSTGFVKYLDGSEEIISIMEKSEGNIIKLSIEKGLNYKGIDYIDLDTERSISKAGDDGYFLIVAGGGGGIDDFGICCFKNREDIEYISNKMRMPVIGVKKDLYSYIGIITGMPMSASLVINIKDGVYRTYARIKINGEEPYEPINMEIHFLRDNECDYNGMARCYRNYQLEKGGFVSIKDRLNDQLQYAADSVYVRIRQAWKPVPCEILEQTLENEPDVHVACTFQRVGELMDEYKKAGIEKAEFCLVGWNIKGHDGRWPQILPVEESLGGESKLKDLIVKANMLGYQITCHTNSSDAYSIANNFDIKEMQVTKDQKPSILAEFWSGGRAYNVCPKNALRISMQTLPEVAKLGFRGLHYIDVITTTQPRNCYSKDHAVNYREGVEYFNKLFEFTRNLFGGSASEGSFDYNLKNCDYCLYVSFAKGNEEYFGLVDNRIPFWQLVYHGIVLSNPYTKTVNAAISNYKENMLKTIEYGGRPAIYYYSRFVDETKNASNWMGDRDFTCDNKDDLLLSVQCAKKQVDIYKEMSYLQTEFMEKHEEVSPNVFIVTYSDGSKITVEATQKILCK